MQPSSIFYGMPIRALYIVAVVFVLFSVEAGYWVGALLQTPLPPRGPLPDMPELML